MSARLNNLTWGWYKAALEGVIDRAQNRGFRMRNGQMTSYHQNKLGLSAYYDKRRDLSDGIQTEPIEYGLHQS
jgi:lipoprotein-anchoring transpeptidase ErfK/SrfK